LIHNFLILKSSRNNQRFHKVLSKYTIESEINLHLSSAKQGFKTKGCFSVTTNTTRHPVFNQFSKIQIATKTGFFATF
jgi:hypothetical protein